MSSASLDSRGGGSLADVLVTDELIRRPVRPPNFEAENAALHALARQMADDGNSLLDSLVDVALDLCCPDGTAGVSLLERTTSGDDVFRWVALAGQMAAHVGGATPRDFSPCGVCLDRNAPQLYAYPERCFPYFASARPIICEGLVLPFSVAGRHAGTIWVASHDEAHRFDGEDVRVMTRLADFTAAAYRLRSEIAERKDAEAALHARGQELRDFVENATEGLHWVGPDGIILWTNQAELDLLGYTRDEYIGHHVAEFHVDSEVVEDTLTRLARGESLRNHEARLRCKDGSVRHVLINSNVLWREGKFVHTRCFTRDVTEIRRLADAMRESELRLRLAIRATHDVIYEMDVRTAEFRFDDSVREVMGHPRDAIPSSIDGALRFWSDHLHPDDRAGAFASYDTALQDVTTDRWAAEYRIRRADGAYAWVTERAVIERDAVGTPMRIVGALQDITAQKEAEEAQREYGLLATFAADIGAALIQQSNLRDALHACTDATARHLNAAFARIWTLNDPGDVLELQASSGMDTHIDGEHARIPVGQFSIGRVAQTRQPHLTNTIIGDPRVPHQEWARQHGLVAFAGYPLLVDDRLVGVMGLFARQPLSDATLNALSALANSIAVGIERKRAEQRLAASEERFRSLSRSSPVGIFQTDINGKCTYTNPRAASICGFTFEESLGEGWTNFVHPEDRERFCNAWMTTVADRQEWVDENRWLHPDGTCRWTVCRAAPHVNDVGEVIGYIGTLEDITGHKKAELELRLSQHVLQTTIDSTPAFVYIVDDANRFCLINRHFGELFGIDAAAAIGQSLYDYFPQDVADQFAANNRRVLESRQILEFEESAPQPGGIRTYVSVKAPVYDADGVAYAICGVSTDITERKRLVAALEHADRQKDAFLATVAHELRQPLGAIQAALGLMRLRVGGENGEKARTVIERQVAHLARLVDDLIDAARIVRGKVALNRQRTALNEIIDAAVAVVQPAVREREQDLRLGVPAEPVWVDGDGNRLQQVFSNLLSNAVKFTPRGGRIELSAEPDVNVVTVRVRDTGCGIASDMLPRVFDLFAQATPNSGLGIGLAVVRGLVERHGGTVDVRSEGEGKGSEFVVRLPMAGSSVSAQPRTQAVDVSADGSRLHHNAAQPGPSRL
jgi:PAS domain S-box-containing protein